VGSCDGDEHHALPREFTFRFNRRFYLFNAFHSLLGIAGSAEALPMPTSFRRMETPYIWGVSALTG
jgi:hypothetical protein